MPGLDLNLDGEMDDVSGPKGDPDGVLDENDELNKAGLVYIILSSTDARNFVNGEGQYDIDIDKLGGAALDGVIIVGYHGERYDSLGGLNHEGDFLGGGNASATGMSLVNNELIFFGGNDAKSEVDGRDRSRGFGIGRAGDVDGDGIDDLLLGAQLADPRIDPTTGYGVRNGGEAYLLYGGFTD